MNIFVLCLSGYESELHYISFIEPFVLQCRLCEIKVSDGHIIYRWFMWELYRNHWTIEELYGRLRELCVGGLLPNHVSELSTVQSLPHENQFLYKSGISPWGSSVNSTIFIEDSKFWFNLFALLQCKDRLNFKFFNRAASIIVCIPLILVQNYIH